MKEIEIRIAKESDIYGLKQVIRKHYSSKPIYFRPICELEQHNVVQSEKNIVFIAKSGNEIIGYINLHSHNSFMNINNEAEFEIVIDPCFRKHGIGKRLLVYAIQYTENETNLKQLIAKISAGNVASEKLCNNCGFYLLNTDSKGSVMILKINR